MKRTVKDSVFANLFADTKYLIKLYRALNPEDKKTEEKDIENVTIKNIKREQSEAIAKNLLAKGQMSIEDIADCTGLSVNEVESLSELAFA